MLELPAFSRAEVAGTELSVPYLNVTIVNGAVIVPLGLHPSDDEALEIIAAAFPDRDTIGVPANVIAYGGGGPHCITQQVPKG